MKMSGLLKKSLAVLFCTVVLAVSFSVSACSLNNNKAQQIIVVANASISVCVLKAEVQADILQHKGYASNSTAILEICTNLQQDTQAIENQAEQKLEAIGATYTCDSYYANIGGNEVLIDPFRSM